MFDSLKPTNSSLIWFIPRQMPSLNMSRFCAGPLEYCRKQRTFSWDFWFPPLSFTKKLLLCMAFYTLLGFVITFNKFPHYITLFQSIHWGWPLLPYLSFIVNNRKSLPLPKQFGIFLATRCCEPDSHSFVDIPGLMTEVYTFITSAVRVFCFIQLVVNFLNYTPAYPPFLYMQFMDVHTDTFCDFLGNPVMPR